MERAQWSYQAGRLIIKVTERVLADADDVINYVIETMARTCLPYAEERADCLSHFGQRFAERGVETTFAVTDEDRSRYEEAAEAYLQAYFPDLIENGDELLRRIDKTVAEIQCQVEDIREWVEDI